MSYQKGSKKAWAGRIDPLGTPDTFYWHQVIELGDIDTIPAAATSKQIVLLGYESDEGVKRNLGRVGAVEGPSAMRAALSKFALHHDHLAYPIHDVGNVITDQDHLESSQLQLANSIARLIGKGYHPVVMGGGHEISYGHFTGIRQAFGSEAKIGIVNFDAHFDLRAYPNGPHSGSPFRQILDESKGQGCSFHYLPVGINPAGNQKALFDVHRQAGQNYILQSELTGDLITQKELIDTFISEVDHVYITLDLDVMPASAAPGVSAPAAFGVTPEVIRELFLHVLDSEKVVSFDIAELSPKYDDGRTAKLAASFIYELVMKYTAS